MLEQLINAMQAENYEAVLQCFHDGTETVFKDYSPLLEKQPLICLCGSNAIRMFFRDRFYPMNRSFRIHEVRITDAASATFFEENQGHYYYSRLSIEQYDEDGLILKAVIRPE